MIKRTADYLFELETSLHKKEIRKSPEAVAALLADDFIEFGSSGRIFNKAAIIEALNTEVIDQQVTVEDFQMRELGTGIALVTHIACKPARNGPSVIRALRSSLWRHANGRWQMIFHQGTRIFGQV